MEDEIQLHKPQEQLNPTQSDVFFNWSPYQGEEIRTTLSSLGIVYIEPKVNKDLRERIEEYLNKTDKRNGKLNEILKTCLKFFESGMMIDNFGNDEEGRHKFLLNTFLKIGDQKMTLYALSKIVNKLSLNKISLIYISSTLIDDETIQTEAEELRKKIIEIEKERGYFKPDDLQDVDKLALAIINHILQS